MPEGRGFMEELQSKLQAKASDANNNSLGGVDLNGNGALVPEWKRKLIEKKRQSRPEFL